MKTCDNKQLDTVELALRCLFVISFTLPPWLLGSISTTSIFVSFGIQIALLLACIRHYHIVKYRPTVEFKKVYIVLKPFILSITLFVISCGISIINYRGFSEGNLGILNLNNKYIYWLPNTIDPKTTLIQMLEVISMCAQVFSTIYFVHCHARVKNISLTRSYNFRLIAKYLILNGAALGVVALCMRYYDIVNPLFFFRAITEVNIIHQFSDHLFTGVTQQHII